MYEKQLKRCGGQGKIFAEIFIIGFLVSICQIPVHAAWEVGDVLERKIDGETYQFRCIDEDYVDMQASGKSLALFLCDCVIPADYGSDYIPATDEGGIYDYQFEPGPIVNFGETNDYKFSAVRKWLREFHEDFADVYPIQAGNSYSYTGSTETGMFSGFLGWELIPHYIGYQQAEDGLFLLSVDEALEYREWLWKFHGSDVDNPDSQTGQFCKGYWLRTPLGEEPLEDSGMVYIVDLINGNIRPERIVPQVDSSDEELCVTGTTGVRPAFVLEQELGF